MTSNPTTAVLIVEDEIFIRMIAADTLEDCGVSVVEAGDAHEALEVLEGDDGIALVFTDITMPGDLDGLDLAAAVAARWPHIELIVTSGAMLLGNADIPGTGRFLAKPYAQDQLVRLVREQLAHAAP